MKLTTSQNASGLAHTSVSDVDGGAAAGELSAPAPMPTHDELIAELEATKQALADAQRRLRAAQDAYLTLEWNWEEVWT